MNDVRRYYGSREDVPVWASALDGPQFRHLRELVEGELSQRGLRFVVGEGIVYVERPAANPSLLLLQPLAQLAKAVPQEQWPTAVAAQVESLLKAEVDEETLQTEVHDFDKVRSRIKMRLYPEELLQAEAAKVLVLRTLAPGIVAGLVFDMPNLIVNVTPEMVKKWDKREDDLFPLSLSNILADGVVQPKEIGEPQGPKIWVLGGPSTLVASHVLLLDRYLDRVPDAGVLVGVPTNHAVLLHPIVDSLAAAAIKVLVPSILTMHRAGPSPLSPHLYWLRNRTLMRIETKVVGSDNIEIFPPADLMKVLGQLGANLQ